MISPVGSLNRSFGSWSVCRVCGVNPAHQWPLAGICRRCAQQDMDRTRWAMAQPRETVRVSNFERLLAPHRLDIKA